MTMHGGVEAQHHVFLVSVLDIVVCSVSRLGDLKHGQKYSDASANEDKSFRNHIC